MVKLFDFVSTYTML